VSTSTMAPAPPPVSGPPVDVDERPPTRTAGWFVWGIAGFTFLGFLVRVMNVLWWRPTTDVPGYHGYRLWGDAFFYHWQANALAKGAWFVDPAAWFLSGSERASAVHPPLYTTYLALWSWIGLDGVTAHRLASSVLGTVTIVVIGLLVRRIAGNTAGLIAAGIAAVYPELWINDGMVLSETAAILAAAVALTAAYVFWAKPSTRTAVLLGLACGVTALGRTELVLLFPLVVIPLAFLVRSVDWRRRVKLAVVACLVGALVIGPWVVANMLRFEEPVTMTSATGSALSAASCDEVYYGQLIGYYANCFQGPWPPASADESQRDIEPRKQAIEYIKNHKKRLPLVAAARVGRLWGLFKPGQTTAFDWTIEGRGRAASWIGLFSYYVLMVFAVVGLVVLRRRRITILPLIAIPVIATSAAAITFGVTRYRAPAEVAIVVAAAVGIDAGWRRLRSRA
jgi:4-amino-4-deoxy-L-arabinose transferase-like glycosyltransferase